MRFLKIYGGALVILIAAVVLFVSFTSDLDKELYNLILICCGAAVIIGVLLMVFLGKNADKIGK